MNILSDFNYYAPESKAEAFELIAKLGDKCKILAGGTDLLIMMKNGLIEPENIVDIGGIKEFAGIEMKDGKGGEIGACTKIADIENSAAVAGKYGALSHAAGEIGSPQVREMATLGGNSCHASPAAETPASLCAYGAKVVISSKDGDREMELKDFIQGNRQNDLKPGEVLTKFIIPEPKKKSACKYGHIGLRKAMEIDAVNMAVNIAVSDDGSVAEADLVMGSVAPRPLVLPDIKDILVGKKVTDDLAEKVGDAAQAAASPISDVRASAEYRKDVIRALAIRLVKEAYDAAKAA
ncbi:MAG: xanthine dehydrogenase family protein subunit M [Clostridiales Family XIII bacterium]|nr:xanthine dehydrogenase family protein subunit M [Clostridiales Family XIII bacterium]